MNQKEKEYKALKKERVLKRVKRALRDNSISIEDLQNVVNIYLIEAKEEELKIRKFNLKGDIDE